jgi:6-phospho-3-hexuloisomerase
MHTKNPEFKIVGVGAGRVGYALRAFIMRLNHFGFNASFIGDTNVPALTSDDMLIVASTSGSTPTISYYTLVGKNQ